MSNDHNQNQTSGWRKRQIALDKKAENARELGLDYKPNKSVIEMARQAGMVYREFEDEFANANTDGAAAWRQFRPRPSKRFGQAFHRRQIKRGLLPLLFG